jgi:hypothetical protein
MKEEEYTHSSLFCHLLALHFHREDFQKIRYFVKSGAQTWKTSIVILPFGYFEHRLYGT